MVTRQEELLERIEGALRENREPLENMERSLKQFAGVGKLLNSIEKEVTKTFGEANDLQRKALGIGTSLNRFTSDFSQNINTLNSGITGYSQALKTSFDLYEAGVRRNNEGLATLAQFTKATGGNSKALAGQLAKNLAGAQVSDKELNSLSMNTISLSQRFGVSTEQLVGAINAMGAQLDNLKALNLGAEAIDASQKLSAALGPEMASLGPELLASFSKGSSMIQTEILNLGNERRAFLAGGEQAAAAGIDLVVEAGAQSQKIIEQFTAGATDSAFALELAGSVYGQEIVKAAKARQQLERKADEAGFKNINEYVKSVKEQQAINTNFTKTLSQLREKIFSPIQEAVTFLAGVLIKILELPVIGTLITQLGKVGVIIGTLVTGALGLGLAIKGLYTGTLKLIRSMTDVVSGQNRGHKSRNELKRAILELKKAIRDNTVRQGLKAAGQSPDMQIPTGDDFGAGVFDDIKDQAKEMRESKLKTAKLSGGIAILSTVLSGFSDQLPESMQPVANSVLKLITVITTLQSAMATLSLIIGKDISFRSAGKVLGKVPGAGKAVGWLSKLKPLLMNGIKLIGPMLLGLGSSLLTGLGAAFSAAIGVLTAPITGIIAAIVAAGVLIWKFKDEIWAAIKWVGGFLWNIISTTAKFLWSAITSIPTMLWNSIKWLADKFMMVGTMWLSAIKWVGSHLWNIISTTAQFLWSAITYIPKQLWKGIKWLADKFMMVGTMIWNGIKGVVGKLNPLNWFKSDDEEAATAANPVANVAVKPVEVQTKTQQLTQDAVPYNGPPVYIDRRTGKATGTTMARIQRMDSKLDTIEKVIAMKNERLLEDAWGQEDEKTAAQLEAVAKLEDIRNNLLEQRNSAVKQVMLAEEAAEARSQQLTEARKDPTRPSQLAGVEPTSR